MQEACPSQRLLLESGRTWPCRICPPAPSLAAGSEHGMLFESCRICLQTFPASGPLPADLAVASLVEKAAAAWFALLAIPSGFQVGLRSTSTSIPEGFALNSLAWLFEFLCLCPEIEASNLCHNTQSMCGSTVCLQKPLKRDGSLKSNPGSQSTLQSLLAQGPYFLGRGPNISEVWLSLGAKKAVLNAAAGVRKQKDRARSRTHRSGGSCHALALVLDLPTSL